MQQNDAVGLEQLGAFTEERVVEADADMLEHADRDDAIVALTDVAVVLQLELHGAAEPLFLGADARGRKLFLRQSDSLHPRAADLGQIKGKAAPA